MFHRRITTVDAAFALLLRSLERVADGKKPSRIAADDERIARFVASAPGALTQKLHAEIGSLATRPCPNGSYPSMLGYILNQSRPDTDAVWSPPALPLTFAAFDDVGFLRFYAAARRQPHDRLGLMARHNSAGLASWYAKRAGVEVLSEVGLTPEQRDTVHGLATGEPLPDILPDDVAAMSPRQIEEALCDYAAVPIAELEERLRPGGMSAAGFLSETETVGTVIHDDAVTLARLAVDRHDLARRLDALVSEPPSDGDLRCEVITSAGHQEDPFHSGDVFALTHRGASFFRIENPALGPDGRCTGGDMVTVLIRRACFFEGNTSYRTDPARAAWVLGLTDARPGGS